VAFFSRPHGVGIARKSTLSDIVMRKTGVFLAQKSPLDNLTHVVVAMFFL
jgi:hypothetical protein